jgi:hypothetical protein
MAGPRAKNRLPRRRSGRWAVGSSRHAGAGKLNALQIGDDFLRPNTVVIRTAAATNVYDALLRGPSPRVGQRILVYWRWPQDGTDGLGARLPGCHLRFAFGLSSKP